MNLKRNFNSQPLPIPYLQAAFWLKWTNLYSEIHCHKQSKQSYCLTQRLILQQTIWNKHNQSDVTSKIYHQTYQESPIPDTIYYGAEYLKREYLENNFLVPVLTHLISYSDNEVSYGWIQSILLIYPGSTFLQDRKCLDDGKL